MGNATFSGPLRVGTQRDGSVTQKNTGTPVLTQSITLPSTAMLFSLGITPIADFTLVPFFTLPAGAKILNFSIETTVAITGANVTGLSFVIGRAGGPANFLTTAPSALVLPLSPGKSTQAQIDAVFSAVNSNNIGATDITVTGSFINVTGAGATTPTGGQLVVTVFYMQRLPNGSIGGDSGS